MPIGMPGSVSQAKNTMEPIHINSHSLSVAGLLERPHEELLGIIGRLETKKLSISELIAPINNGIAIISGVWKEGACPEIRL
jgi:hypothetical protein